MTVIWVFCHLFRHTIAQALFTHSHRKLMHVAEPVAIHTKCFNPDRISIRVAA